MVKEQNYYTVHSADEFSRDMGENLVKNQTYGSAERLATSSQHRDYSESSNLRQIRYSKPSGGKYYRHNDNIPQRSRYFDSNDYNRQRNPAATYQNFGCSSCYTHDPNPFTLNRRSFSYQNLATLESFSHYNNHQHYSDRGISYFEAPPNSMPVLTCNACAHASQYRWTNPNWRETGAWPRHFEAEPRCICSRDSAKRVVPIEQYLETYFDSHTVRI